MKVKHSKVDDHFTQNIFAVQPETIKSPLRGKVIPLAAIRDPLFATETVGKGIAIEPEAGKIYSPVDGVITTQFPTGHAVGITSEDGAEVLVYIGLDTVKLKGKYITPQVKQGDYVKQGDLLIEFEMDQIKAAGFETTTLVVITNTDQYLDVKAMNHDAVEQNEPLLKLTV